MFGGNFHINDATLRIYSIQSVYEALSYLFQFKGKLYTNVLKEPPENPTVKFITVEALKPMEIEGYGILPVPVNHSVPAVGFQITSPEGRKFFYTGDTGTGLEECWQHITPDLLIIETTASNRYVRECQEKQHLCPSLLKEELLAFRRIKGYLPQVITIHMFPHQPEAEERRAELIQIAANLNASITPGYEGMEIVL